MIKLFKFHLKFSLNKNRMDVRLIMLYGVILIKPNIKFPLNKIHQNYTLLIKIKNPYFFPNTLWGIRIYVSY